MPRHATSRQDVGNNTMESGQTNVTAGNIRSGAAGRTVATSGQALGGLITVIIIKLHQKSWAAADHNVDQTFKRRENFY